MRRVWRQHQSGTHGVRQPQTRQSAVGQGRITRRGAVGVLLSLRGRVGRGVATLDLPNRRGSRSRGGSFFSGELLEQRVGRRSQQGSRQAAQAVAAYRLTAPSPCNHILRDMGHPSQLICLERARSHHLAEQLAVYGVAAFAGSSINGQRGFLRNYVLSEARPLLARAQHEQAHSARNPAPGLAPLPPTGIGAPIATARLRVYEDCTGC